MNCRTIEVGWDYEVPVEEVDIFRNTRETELEGYYGAPVQTLTDLDVAKYMVRISFPSPHYLKAGQKNLTFHD